METILSAGIVLFRRLRPGAPKEYLLLRVYRNWDLPKGVVEVGEEPQQTALRELCEETGLQVTMLTLPQPEAYTDTTPYKTNHEGRRVQKVVRFFVAQLHEVDVKLVVSPEHHEARWFGVDEALSHLVPRLQEVISWANAQRD